MDLAVEAEKLSRAVARHASLTLLHVCVLFGRSFIKMVLILKAFSFGCVSSHPMLDDIYCQNPCFSHI